MAEVEAAYARLEAAGSADRIAATAQLILMVFDEFYGRFCDFAYRAKRAFEEMRQQNARAIADIGSGTIEGITAMGISYLDFAVSQPAIFRLMFGELKKVQGVDESGRQCLKNLVDEIAFFSRKHGHNADAEQIAIRLWTFVHGASSLQLDDNYEHVAPGLDVRALIADVTPRLLGVAPEKRVPASGKKR